MRLTTTNITMLLIGILLLLSAWANKPMLDSAKELVKTGKLTRTPPTNGTTTNPLDAAAQAGADVRKGVDATVASAKDGSLPKNIEKGINVAKGIASPFVPKSPTMPIIGANPAFRNGTPRYNNTPSAV